VVSFAGIEVYGSFDVLLLDLVKEGFYEVPVRIQDCHPIPFSISSRIIMAMVVDLVCPGLPIIVVAPGAKFRGDAGRSS